MKHDTMLLSVMLAAVLTIGQTVMAATLRTAAMEPGSGQMLVCTVVNLSGKPLAISAEILDRWGNNVTCFVRTDWDATETVLLTLHAEATSADGRYCRITVKNGRKAMVAASIQACTFDLTVCTAPVVAR